MENPTVKDLIEALQEMPQDSIVCVLDDDRYYSVDLCEDKKDVRYVDDSGITRKSDIVLITTY